MLIQNLAGRDCVSGLYKQGSKWRGNKEKHTKRSEWFGRLLLSGVCRSGRS